MNNKKFLKIAACLGLVVPASILTATETKAETIDLNASIQERFRGQQNEVNARILNMYTSVELEDANNPAHTNVHTDYGANHMDSHTDTPHANYHTNKIKNTCPEEHTDYHSNRSGQDSHTDMGEKDHTNTHTDRMCP